MFAYRNYTDNDCFVYACFAFLSSCVNTLSYRYAVWFRGGDDDLDYDQVDDDDGDDDDSDGGSDFDSADREADGIDSEGRPEVHRRDDVMGKSDGQLPKAPAAALRRSDALMNLRILRVRISDILLHVALPCTLRLVALSSHVLV